MRIVIATPLYPPDIGGPASYAKHLHDEFQRRGHSVSVVSYGPFERALPAGVRHLVYFFRILPHAVRARSILALDTWSVGLPALVAAFFTRAKLVVRVGGDFLWESYVWRTGDLVRFSEFYTTPRALSFKERIIRRGTGVLMRHVGSIAFNTAWQRDIWQKAYRFSGRHAAVIENYFPPQEETPAAPRRAFVAAGRAHPLKNLTLLEQVFARVRQDFPDSTLDTRPLAPTEHEARVRDSYAVIISSISDMNPNAASEAVRFGRPFIAPADTGAQARLGTAGIFIDTKDPAALEAAIRALLDPDGYAAAVARVRMFSFTHSWADIAGEFLALLT